MSCGARDPWENERRLCVAIMLDAANVLSGKRKCWRRVRPETLEWVESDATWPFSYLWICEQLDLDPDVMRAAMLNAEDTGRRTILRIRGNSMCKQRQRGRKVRVMSS